MEHLPLQVAVHLVERELHEPTRLISPGLDDTFRNHFNRIGIGAIKSDGRDVAAIRGLANTLIEQPWRQEPGGHFQGDWTIVWSPGLAQPSQPIDKGLDRFGSKTVLTQRFLE